MQVTPSGFNPRRPVSRPATIPFAASALSPWVSIHADRFPGRRLAAANTTAKTHGFQSTPTGVPAGDPKGRSSGCTRMLFQSTPTGFPAGDLAWLFRCSAHGVSIHADRFPGRRPQRSSSMRWPRGGFNPRRPVSRPATSCSACPRCARSGFNPRRPVSRPATCRDCKGLCRAGVSIHADRFPGRRRKPLPAADIADVFQSTPTGFPAGDDPFAAEREAAKVSIHADRFPGRRQRPKEPTMNMLMFQSTPTGFPAGDMLHWCMGVVPAGFNPRRPVSRPATGRLLAAR